MRSPAITVHHSIFISRAVEAVWDFTQNYDLRNTWDPSVKKASVVHTAPQRVVILEMYGWITMTFIYKLDDRPHKTTLAARDVSSLWISSGGGSWQYEPHSGGTQWTQTNTLILKNTILSRLLRPIIKWVFTLNMRRAMSNVKRILEHP